MLDPKSHRNANCWNVFMWLRSTPALYSRAVELCTALGIVWGSRTLAQELQGQQTPDGVPFTRSALRDACKGILGPDYRPGLTRFSSHA